MIRSSLLVFAACLVCACGVHPTPGSTPPAESATSASDIAAAKETATILRGRITANDGSPLIHGGVSAQGSAHLEPFAEAELSPDGRFEVELPGPGFYRLEVHGVHHAQERIDVFVDEPGKVTFNGALGTYWRRALHDELPVRVRWIVADEMTQVSAQTAKRVDEGFELALTPPDGATAFQYQITDIFAGRSVDGPGGERFVHDGGGDYWTEVDLPKDHKLRIDLSQLPREAQKSALVVEGATVARSTDARKWLSPFSDQVIAARQKASAARKASGAKVKVRRSASGVAVALAEPDPELVRLALAAREDIEETQDVALKKARTVEYAWFFGQFTRFNQIPMDELTWILDALEPTDRQWAAAGPNIATIFELMKDNPDAQAYLEQMIANHFDPGVVATGLWSQIDAAALADDQDRVRELYAELTTRFPGTFAAWHTRNRYDPGRPLQAGRPMLNWEFPTLEGPKVSLSSESFRGKPYLLEIWATWCGPCVGEMESLHSAYARVNGKKAKKAKKAQKLETLRAAKDPKIEFVALSFDEGPEVVQKFRAEQWSMPWHHMIVSDEVEKELHENWQFSGVPTVVLVDADGVIVMVNEGLRGEMLAETLAEMVAD